MESDIGNEFLQCNDEFYYLGDMTDAGQEVDQKLYSKSQEE